MSDKSLCQSQSILPSFPPLVSIGLCLCFYFACKFTYTIFLASTYMRFYIYLFFSLWLISLSVTVSRSTHIAENGTISFLLWLSNSPLYIYCCSITKLCLTLQSNGLQHARLPCPSPSPEICLSSCPLNQWCHSTISSPVILFSCFQSFPESGSFPMRQLTASGGQSIGISALASVLPKSIQGWFPLRLTSLISLLSKGLSSDFFKIQLKKSIFQLHLDYNPRSWAQSASGFMPSTFNHANFVSPTKLGLTFLQP